MRKILIVLGFLIVTFPAFAAEAGGSSAYDRVMKTGTLRCGYIVYPPETIKDPNTGKLSGTLVDTVEELGKKLGIKIDWAEEVSFTSMFEGVRSGRHDALCAGLFENPQRAKAVLFSIPSNYGVTYAFARANDTRFDKGISTINKPGVTIATIDGELAQAIAEEQFPQAKRLALPQLSDISLVLESVASKKADVAFLQKGPAKAFIQNNSGKIKIIGSEPIQAYPAPPFAFAPEEVKLKLMFDAAIRSLLLNGSVEKILRKYDRDLDSYRLVAKPYEGAK